MSAHRSQPVDPDAAQRAARRILSGRRFRNAHTPRPLRKPLSWLGDRLHGIAQWFSDVLARVPALLWYALVISAVALAIVFVVNKVRERRSRPDTARREGRLAADDAETASDLERQADAAERAGDLEAALRLRFRAGLLRLGDRGAIRYRPSVTTNEVRRVLGSDTFNELARTFEAVAYGGRDAMPPDVETARREWPRVVSSAGKPPTGVR